MLTKEMTTSPFAGKVRVRVCGILLEKDKILLLKHRGVGAAGTLWSPPGGGVDFGHSLEHTLIKEFKEETHLTVSVGPYLFANEHIDEHHHAIELFFEVRRVSGELKLGHDPELPPSDQMLSDIKFLSLDEIKKMDDLSVHYIFSQIKSLEEILNIRGLITFKDY